MKRFVQFLLILLIIPIYVSAKEDCSPNEVKITSIEVQDKSNLVEGKEPTVDKLKVGLDLSFVKVNSYINYKIVINNNSSKEYKLNEDDLKEESDYIKYEISYENGNIIPPKEEKTVFLRVTYNKEVPEDQFKDGFLKEDKTVNLSFSREGNELINPPTGFLISSILLILSILLSLLVITKKKKYMVSLFLLGFIPISTYALCNFNISIDSKVSIDGRKAIFQTGTEVNIKMKRLAGDEAEERSFPDNNITKILYSPDEPEEENKQEANVVSIEGTLPIYMWFDEGTIYWWSEDKAPELNPDASFMLARLINLVDLVGISNWDSSNAEEFIAFCQQDESLTTLDAFSTWNMSKATTLSSMFNYCYSITSLEGLTNWDVSNVKNMKQLIHNCIHLKSLKGLENWNTASLEVLDTTFHNLTSLEDASAISNWNVSKVYDMTRLFNVSTDDPSGLKYSALKELDLRNWDLSSVISYSYFMCNLRYVKSEFTIRKVPEYRKNVFTNVACEEGSQVIVNYTQEVADVIDDIIATKSAGCNVEKGRLVE